MKHPHPGCDGSSEHAAASAAANSTPNCIMGSGTFSGMLSQTEEDWQKIRDAIQSTNAADKSRRG